MKNIMKIDIKDIEKHTSKGCSTCCFNSGEYCEAGENYGLIISNARNLFPEGCSDYEILYTEFERCLDIEMQATDDRLGREREDLTQLDCIKSCDNCEHQQFCTYGLYGEHCGFEHWEEKTS